MLMIALLFRDQIIDVHSSTINKRFSSRSWRGRSYPYCPSTESTTWGLMPFWFFFQAKIREGSKKEFGPEDSQNENEFA